MEWIIGFVILVLAIAFFLAKKGTQLQSVDELSTAVDQIRLLFDPLKDEMFPVQVASDSYLLGFMQTFISLQGHFKHPSMSTTEKGNFLLSVVEKVFGSDSKMIADRMIVLAGSTDTEFWLGSDHASQVVLLALQKLNTESMAEPQIQYVLKNAGKASIDGKSSYEGAAAMLMADFLLAHKQTRYPERV